MKNNFFQLWFFVKQLVNFFFPIYLWSSRKFGIKYYFLKSFKQYGRRSLTICKISLWVFGPGFNPGKNSETLNCFLYSITPTFYLARKFYQKHHKNSIVFADFQDFLHWSITFSIMFIYTIFFDCLQMLLGWIACIFIPSVLRKLF